MILVLCLFSCEQGTKRERNDSFRIECNSDNKEQFHQIFSGEVKTKLGGSKTDKEFFSAPSSIRVDTLKPYAFTTRFEDVVEDQYFKFSIWRKDPTGSTNLIVQGDPAGIFYLNRPEIVERREDGWEKLVSELEVPPGVRTVSVYAYAPRNYGFFDDLVVESSIKKEYPDLTDRSGLHLYFTQGEMEFFKSERQESYQEGVHFSRDRWSKGVLSDESMVIPIDARLKGDWLDHMQGKKWSFRIKTKEDASFRRMRAFSVQTPESRYFLHEYLAHELFTSEGILTTRYSFTPLYINTQNTGVYALEEHFAKQLIEYNLRREGPILKFDEDPFWRVNALTVGVNKKTNGLRMPVFETSKITSFGAKKVLADTNLRKQYTIAHSLLYQFKERQAPVDELFDVDKLAKYLALTDLVDGKHGFIWHNMRFYYNPVLCKLEPINYDNFTDHHAEKPANISALNWDKNSKYPRELNMIHSFFGSDKLLEMYVDYLEQYIQEGFVDEFLKEREEEINGYAQLIATEFPMYDLPADLFQSNALQLKERIDELKSRKEKGYFRDLKLSDTSFKIDTENSKSINHHFVNIYYSKDGTGKGMLLAENYSGARVQISELLNDQKEEIYSLDDIEIGVFGDLDSDTLLSVPFFESATYARIYFPELDQSHVVDLTPYRKNTDPTPYQLIKNDTMSNPLQLFVESGDSLILRKGDYTLRNKLLIPEGKVVVIEPGVDLDMVDSATVISHSHLILKGTAEEPILIHSSDSSANGFNVLQAGQKSYVSHTVFSNLNTLSYQGWSLTGAVNFYESDVDIDFTRFENNHCEDALNIIRSTFLVENSSFYGIYSDAFDSDFCNGLLSQSTFDKIGNDAIDFSTSQIDILDCKIMNANDKGISGGEQSTLNVRNCVVKNCNIGVASKDLSEVNLQDVTITDSNYGLVALRKKPEYGGAFLTTAGLIVENCVTYHLIEKGSLLNLDGRKIEGTVKDVYLLFY